MNNLKKDVSFNKNEDQIKLMISNLNLKLDKIYLGGGKESPLPASQKEIH